jgi:hypothetical protein
MLFSWDELLASALPMRILFLVYKGVLTRAYRLKKCEEKWNPT